jgi:hypothetical protein
MLCYCVIERVKLCGSHLGGTRFESPVHSRSVRLYNTTLGKGRDISAVRSEVLKAVTDRGLLDCDTVNTY